MYEAISSSGVSKTCFTLQQAIYGMERLNTGNMDKSGNIVMPDGHILLYDGLNWVVSDRIALSWGYTDIGDCEATHGDVSVRVSGCVVVVTVDLISEKRKTKLAPTHEKAKEWAENYINDKL